LADGCGSSFRGGIGLYDLAVFIALSQHLGRYQGFQSSYSLVTPRWYGSITSVPILIFLAFVQLCGLGIGLAAFVYGLATDLNGKCNAAGYDFCAVVRITLGFDTLTWYSPSP
jgi:hypothetical protein